MLQKDKKDEYKHQHEENVERRSRGIESISVNPADEQLIQENERRIGNFFKYARRDWEKLERFRKRKEKRK